MMLVQTRKWEYCGICIYCMPRRRYQWRSLVSRKAEILWLIVYSQLSHLMYYCACVVSYALFNPSQYIKASCLYTYMSGLWFLISRALFIKEKTFLNGSPRGKNLHQGRGDDLGPVLVPFGIENVPHVNTYITYMRKRIYLRRGRVPPPPPRPI